MRDFQLTDCNIPLPHDADGWGRFDAELWAARRDLAELTRLSLPIVGSVVRGVMAARPGTKYGDTREQLISAGTTEAYHCARRMVMRSMQSGNHIRNGLFVAIHGAALNRADEILYPYGPKPSTRKQRIARARAGKALKRPPDQPAASWDGRYPEERRWDQPLADDCFDNGRQRRGGGGRRNRRRNGRPRYLRTGWFRPNCETIVMDARRRAAIACRFTTGPIREAVLLVLKCECASMGAISALVGVPEVELHDELRNAAREVDEFKMALRERGIDFNDYADSTLREIWLPASESPSESDEVPIYSSSEGHMFHDDHADAAVGDIWRLFTLGGIWEFWSANADKVPIYTNSNECAGPPEKAPAAKSSVIPKPHFRLSGRRRAPRLALKGIPR
jgi:hypothetical protein